MKNIFAIFLFIVSAGVLSACRSVEIIETDQVVIFVPGFYGTRLKTRETQKTVWINFSEAVFKDRRLNLPVPGLERFPAIDVVPAGILDKVDVVPLIYSQDAYGSVLDFLSRQKNHRLVEFPYDWRKNLDETSEKLRLEIGRLKSEGKKVWIIAHSMGGLIATQALRFSDKKETWEGLSQVEGVLISGTPFRGVPAVFRNMNSSLKIALNSKIVDAFAYSTFESSFYLLPSGEEDQMIKDGNLVRGSIRNPDNWNRGWGVASFAEQESLVPSEIEAYQSFAKQWLTLSEEFNQRLHSDQTTKAAANIYGSKIQFLTGRGTPTVARGFYDEEFFPYFWEKDLRRSKLEADAQRTLGDGDGTVSVTSCLPPKAWLARGGTVEVFELEHGALINDKKIQPILLDFLSFKRAGSRAEAH